MRLKHTVLLSGSLLLASCGMQATPTAPVVTPEKTVSTTVKAPPAAVKPTVEPSVTLENAAAMQAQGLLDPVFKLVFRRK